MQLLEVDGGVLAGFLIGTGSSLITEGVAGVDLEFTYANTPASPPCGGVTSTSSASVGQFYDALGEVRVAAVGTELPADASARTRERVRALGQAPVGLGATVAAALVTDAAPYAGNAEAVEQFDAGVAAWRDGDGDGALELLEDAARTAFEALDAPTDAPVVYPSPTTLLALPHIVLMPDASVDIPGITVGDVTLTIVEVTGAPAGASVDVVPGWEQQGVVLTREFSPDGLRENELIGLARASGYRVDAPGADCPVPHVVADPDGAGVRLDGLGPFPTPSEPCGFGEAVSTAAPLHRGAIPAGTTFGDGPAFRVRLALDDTSQGRHTLTVAARTDGGDEHVSTLELFIDPGPADYAPTTTRFAGDDRLLTGIEIAQRFSTGVDTVYLARADDFPDALAAGPATHGEGPVLLVNDALTPELRGELRRLAPRRVVLSGGAAVLPDSIAAEVREVLDDVVVLRVWGQTRIGTAVALSRFAFTEGAHTAVLATGFAFPDALSVGALAGREGGPLLLVRQDDVDDAVLDEIERLGVRRVVVAGGPVAVAETVLDTVRTRFSGVEVTRLSGADRFATSGAVAAGGTAVATTAWVATGANFPDALTATPAAIADGAVVLLIQPRDVPEEARDTLASLEVRRLLVAGGTEALPEAAVEQLAGG